MTPPNELAQTGKSRGDGPRILVAEEAIPHPDAVNNRIILDMRNFRSSYRDKDGKVITTAAPNQIEVLQAQKQEELQVNKTVREMDTGPLYRRVAKGMNCHGTTTWKPRSSCISASLCHSLAFCWR